MKHMLIGGISAAVLLIILSSFFGIGIKSIVGSDDPRDILISQINELNQEIEELKSKNEKYVLENTDLKAQIQGLIASQSGGMEIEEKRKALIEREASMERRERRLVRREEATRLAEEKVSKQQQEFYEKTGLKVEEIGEAKQIKKDYEYMKRRLEESEKLANRWLIGIAVGIFVLVGFLIYTANKSRKIDVAMRTIDSIDTNTEENRKLLTSLDERI